MQYGCLPAKKDLRDYKLCSANMPQDYPKAFQLENLPKVKSQGCINSCCAHATSSILEYFDKNRHIMSTNFIYGIQKKLFNQNQMGMYLAQACAIVKDYGDMLEKDCKGNNEIPISWGIAEAAFNNKDLMEKAYEYRTISYYACNSNNDIKYALMNYGPVLGAIYWRDKYSLDSNNVIHFDKASNGGGHAIMVYGWNEKGWLIQNSWGEAFGNKGRFILPFDYGLVEARAMIDYENPEDLTLCRPKNNKVFNIFYKIANFFINLFK